MKVKTIMLLILFVVLPACSALLKPSEQKIKEDLIGKTVGTAFFSWRFDSIDEFEDFEIIDKKSSGNLIEYKVDVTLKDLSNGLKASAGLVINYRREGGEWRLVNVTDWNSLKLIK